MAVNRIVLAINPPRCALCGDTHSLWRLEWVRTLDNPQWRMTFADQGRFIGPHLCFKCIEDIRKLPEIVEIPF